MLAPLGAKVVDVFPAVFPVVAFNVPVSLPPMLAPPGAKVVVVVLLVVVAFAPPLPFTGGLTVAVVAFCGKQADCMSDVVVTLAPLSAGPIDAPLGACVAAVSLLPPVAYTG